ncbi:diguanylate cyclase [bacterium]|nr:diguanylate cyclase [bacterium]
MYIYIWFLIITIIIAVATCAVIFKRRNIKGAKAMLSLMGAVTFWSATYICEILSNSAGAKIFWYSTEYFAIATVPFFWLFFALQYADFDKIIINKKINLFLIVPIITIILVWTNKYHNLMIGDILNTIGTQIPVVIKSNGTWFWVNMIYSYLLIGAGSVILVFSGFKLPSLYIKQRIVLIIAISFPVIGSILYIFKLNPIAPFDLTPVVCLLSGVLLTYSLFKLKIFQLAPIARDFIFNTINDGVLVFDNGGKIIDANQSLQTAIGFQISEVIGQDIGEFLNHRNINIDLNLNQSPPGKNKVPANLIEKNKEEVILELFISANQKSHPEKHFFSLRNVPIKKNDNILLGHMIIFHDVTESRIYEQSLSGSKKKIEDLNKISHELSMCDKEEQVYSKTAFAIEQITDFSLCSFFINDDGNIKNKFNSHPIIEKLTGNEVFPNKIIYNFFENGKPILLEISNLAEVSPEFQARFPEISSILGIPISDIGIVLLFNGKNLLQNDENIRLCILLLEHTAESLKRVWLQETLKEQALRDPLTGVYNRRYFNQLVEKEIERSKRYGYLIMLIMTDVNRFKEINDKFGHQVGDKVLQGVGKVLESQIRKFDTVIRYGGDEFLIVLPEINGKNTDNFIIRIREAISYWNKETRLVDFDIGLSIGFSYWDPALNESIDKTLYYADMKMYEDKNKNRK